MPRFTAYSLKDKGTALIVETLSNRQVKVRLSRTKEVITVPFDSLEALWSAKWQNEERDGLNNDQVRSKIRPKARTVI